jgi:hypothetical protein
LDGPGLAASGGMQALLTVVVTALLVVALVLVG